MMLLGSLCTLKLRTWAGMDVSSLDRQRCLRENHRVDTGDVRLHGQSVNENYSLQWLGRWHGSALMMNSFQRCCRCCCCCSDVLTSPHLSRDSHLWLHNQHRFMSTRLNMTALWKYAVEITYKAPVVKLLKRRLCCACTLLSLPSLSLSPSP